MNDVLSWDAPEHHHIEKTSDWYWSLGIIAIAIAVLCILLNNILFGIFILLAALVTALHASRAPRLVHIELNPRGIQVEHKLYEYAGLDSFWIEEHTRQPSIILKSKKFFMPYIVIPIGHIPFDEIHSYLGSYLPAIEHHESLGHMLLEYFGF